MKILNRPGFQGWDVHEQKRPQPIYTFHNSFPFAGDVIDVLVFIYAKEDYYEIQASAEARTAGPNDVLEGYAQTLAEALDRAEQVCRRWAERF
ncbi:MAG: hypothetical protein AAGF95_23730 [Chloroflexota bacterium]